MKSSLLNCKQIFCVNKNNSLTSDSHNSQSSKGKKIVLYVDNSTGGYGVSCKSSWDEATTEKVSLFKSLQCPFKGCTMNYTSKSRLEIHIRTHVTLV
jgi:hypothetical protein